MAFQIIYQQFLSCFTDTFSYKEVRSFVENKIPGKCRTKDFIRYNRKALSRIYPKAQRMESSNYDPYPLWAVGCHMVALNYQTAGSAVFKNIRQNLIQSVKYERVRIRKSKDTYVVFCRSLNLDD